MTEARPVLDQINIVTANFAESLAFYRLLGVSLPADGVFEHGGASHHANAESDAGAHFDIDSTTFAQVWNTGWKGRDDLNGRVLVNFRFESRDDVDARYRELTAAGYQGLHAPCDAFWGARFAVVQDPSGVAVGLMSPAQDQFRSPAPEF